MKRPWQIWLTFTLCSGMVIGSMGWFTYTVLDLRHQNREALEQAAVEDVIRRALWRMEAAVSPILIEESSRPYFDYNTFSPKNKISPEGGIMVQGPDGPIPSPLLVDQPEIFNVYFQFDPDGNMTSPQVPDKSLIPALADNKELNHILDSNGACFAVFQNNLGAENLADAYARNWGTPTNQTPQPEDIDTTHKTEEQSENLNTDQMIAQNGLARQQQEASQQRLSQTPWQVQSISPQTKTKGAPLTKEDPQVGKVLNPDVANAYVTEQIEVNRIEGTARENTISKGQYRAIESKKLRYQNYQILNNDRQQKSSRSEQPSAVQQASSGSFSGISSFWGNRSQPQSQTAENADPDVENYELPQTDLFPEAQQQTWTQQGLAQQIQNNVAAAPQTLDYTPEVPIRLDGSVNEDIMRPFWLKDMLIVARRVQVDNKPYIQGAWLNWPRLEKELLTEIRDLLPQAKLVKIGSGQTVDQSRALAALPVALIPGGLGVQPVINEPSIHLPLGLAWASVLLASMAVAFLLAGVVILSERRATFVSAVTHELRTPLTTFRLYTEMLAEGIIRDQDKRDEYVNTLYRESNRLGHLVENVLAYARLERGTGARNLETLKISDLLERVRSPLTTRASQAGMELLIEHNSPDGEAYLHTDQPAVEQILYNLVDNASKYAGNGDDRRIHLSATRQRGGIALRVCDHGPGLDKREARRVFRPFRKSASKAAQSAPGVGLGLALCSRLARQLGGRLRYEDRPETGACFTLILPIGQHRSLKNLKNV